LLSENYTDFVSHDISPAREELRRKSSQLKFLNIFKQRVVSHKDDWNSLILVTLPNYSFEI
jgi:hypothetical protein